MFSSDSLFNLSDMTNEMNPSYESFDLNEDGLDETSTQSLDLDVNGDGIPDQTPFDLDNGDGIPDQTQQVDYIDPQLNPLSADNADFVGDLEDIEHWHLQGDKIIQRVSKLLVETIVVPMKSI